MPGTDLIPMVITLTKGKGEKIQQGTPTGQSLEKVICPSREGGMCSLKPKSEPSGSSGHSARI